MRHVWPDAAGPPSAGGKFPTLNANESSIFAQAPDVFNEVDSVSGSMPGEDWSAIRRQQRWVEGAARAGQASVSPLAALVS